MNKDCLIQPTFAFATYPEYLDAIAQVEGGVINEGSALNLVRFQCSTQFLRGLVATQQIRSWAVVNGHRVEHLRVAVGAQGKTSIFEFDLGSRLEAKPYNQTSDQWLLFEPSGYVFSLRGDGHHSHNPSNTLPDEKSYKPLQ